MDPVPLSEEDRAILALESDTIAGHTCKVIRVEGPGVDLGSLRERVAARLDSAPLLMSRLGGEAATPSWVADPDFAVERHVVAAGEGRGGGAMDPGAVPGLVAELFAEHLDRDRPLWRLDVSQLSSGETLLVWRVHHALADGMTCMRLTQQLLLDPEPAYEASGPTAAVGSQAAHTEADHERRRGHLAKLLTREFSESAHHSPFDSEVGRRREVAFATVPLPPLHDAAKELCGASVNDAVLTVVAGGIRAWLDSVHETAETLRFKVPVSLHTEGDDAGNRDSFFTLPVHLQEPDARARLEAIHAAAAERKRDHDAERLESLSESAERRAPALAALLKRVEASPRSFALCVSNVPGPRAAVRVAGARVRSLHSLAEIGRRHGLRVAVVSLAGELHFGVCADPALLGDLTPLVAGIEADAAALSAAAPRQP
ncbi:MAG TPA: wax ester/triacylglycerol synthase domain-containing protein [Solirubrobacterales bacterium]|nr:wax ester/triacylglycerol synthase domain-containing protein [Solirubrobacterales bacterium]